MDYKRNEKWLHICHDIARVACPIVWRKHKDSVKNGKKSRKSFWTLRGHYNMVLDFLVSAAT